MLHHKGGRCVTTSCLPCLHSRVRWWVDGLCDLSPQLGWQLYRCREELPLRGKPAKTSSLLAATVDSKSQMKTYVSVLNQKLLKSFGSSDGGLRVAVNHSCQSEWPKMTKTIFVKKKIQHALLFVCLMSHPITWSGQDLWPILQPTTRGRSICFLSTFGELSSCPSLSTVYVTRTEEKTQCLVIHCKCKCKWPH